MPITGVYFIPAHPNATTALAAVTERLRAAYPDEDLAPMGRWTLEQKLMRDTPSLLPASANPSAGKPRYMQFMHLSHSPKNGFLYTSESPEKPFHPPHSATPTPAPSFQGNPSSQSTSTPPSLSQSTSLSNSFAADVPPMIMTVLPLQSFNMLFQHFVYACQPFWAHRLTLAVPQGVIYDMGDFRVRLGDVRQTFPTARPRGTLIEIEWRGPTVIDTVAAAYSVPGRNDDGDSDSGIEVDFSVIEEADIDAEFEATATLIRDFWGRLRVEGAREAILVPGFGKEVKERFSKWQARKAGGKDPVVDSEDLHVNADLARQYMEVLRFNR